MPGFNQTGPTGEGPMTGRRMGRCTHFGENLKDYNSETRNDENENLFENYKRRGFGFGRSRWGEGFGMGRQNRFRGGYR